MPLSAPPEDGDHRCACASSSVCQGWVFEGAVPPQELVATKLAALWLALGQGGREVSAYETFDE